MNAGIAQLYNGDDAGDETEDGRDDCQRERPRQRVTFVDNLQTIDQEPDHHEENCKETETDECDDGGVLADGMDTHVDTDQEERYQKHYESYTDHCLDSVEPVFLARNSVTSAAFPESLASVTLERPSLGHESNDEQNYGETEKNEDGAGLAAETDRVNGHVGRHFSEILDRKQNCNKQKAQRVK